jgi:hypothetical protein
VTSGRDNAERTLDEFWRRFTSEAHSRSGYLVGRTVGDGSERFFTISRDDHEIGLNIHVSLSRRGFWGLQTSTVRSLLSKPAWFLVLLRSIEAGYCLPVREFRAVTPRFSKQASGALRINESSLPADSRFGTTAALCTLIGI